MPYYLSKENKEIFDALSKILQESSGDIKLPTPTPKRLAYILRNAANIEENKWFKDKFIIKVIEPIGGKEGAVICKIRKPRFEVEAIEQQQKTIFTNTNKEEVKEEYRFFDIANDIIKSNTNNTLGEKREYPSKNLTEEEQVKLNDYCQLIGYNFLYKDNLVTILKK